MGDSEDIEFYTPLGKSTPITAGENANDKKTRNPDVTAAKSKAGAGDFGPKLRVTLCILFAELCERLTFYGVAGNLLLFCKQDLNMSSATGSTLVLVFGGMHLYNKNWNQLKSFVEEPRPTLSNHKQH